jgi:hypothetical protein
MGDTVCGYGVVIPYGTKAIVGVMVGVIVGMKVG